MYDEIRIEGLQVYAHHGVYQGENEVGQNFIVNAVLYTDTKRAGYTDKLDYSTNYGEVCHFISNQMKSVTYKLIEKVAEELAKGILMQFPFVKALDLEVMKPQAPIGLPFSNVSVKIHRQWERVYLAFGSNMGDKEEHIKNGLAALTASLGVRMGKCSDYLVTKPYGGVEQDDFVNGAVEIFTCLNPFELLDLLHEIEKSEKRERLVHWGPRTLDLDILFYGDEVIEADELIVPHADMANRDFVLEPLMQICPKKKHPITEKTVEEMLIDLKQR